MIKIAPVRKQVTVMASQQRAFDWFTQEMSRWWQGVIVDQKTSHWAGEKGLLRCSGVLGVLLLGGYSSAEVAGVSANGFEVKETAHVAAAPDKAFAALLQPARWWTSEHTFSGNAANLTLDARAGGCWCESLSDGGSVEHMRVVFLSPGKVLRMRGALGPFQSLAVDGVMTWAVKPSANGADISVTYAVGGYSKDGFDKLSKAADQVLGVQIERLRKLIDS